jgi:FixJ family two-component response regulator
VVVTADEGLRAAAEARGAGAFLVKPFEVPDLIDAIRRAGGPVVDLGTAEVRVTRSRH